MRTHRTIRRMGLAKLGLGLTALMLSGGCGKKTGPELANVKGVVLLDGKPLEDAIVIFQPKGLEASPSSGTTATDGRFELSFNRYRKGAQPGEHRVKITTARVVSDDSGRETVVTEKLPLRYHEKTELSYTVKTGENDFEIRLDSKGAPKARATAQQPSRG